MNGDDMTRGGTGSGGSNEDRLAAEPLDDSDVSVLQEVAALYEQVDPVPPDLVDRVKFSLALDEMFSEVARITRLPVDAMAVRSEPTAEVRTETLTFSTDELTVMVSVSRGGRAGLRIDGWVAPAGVTTVQLRLRDETRELVTDESGRFVLEGLPEGFAQMTFRSSREERGSVVTPVFEL
ncbi:carboxypeptidase regulatory-like domain-containing protein [Nocardioides caldifontis]|uniref:carboxypeptidase regulatory-like domain-containing protein n=1 Tax=Nocardioides caldifontis TaxID=2588938 RepID=UPI0011DF1709|nr:carboxypeptidase regulatory-like domain-containing protein [Nocardioides caldifontis]